MTSTQRAPYALVRPQALPGVTPVKRTTTGNRKETQKGPATKTSGVGRTRANPHNLISYKPRGAADRRRGSRPTWRCQRNATPSSAPVLHPQQRTGEGGSKPPTKGFPRLPSICAATSKNRGRAVTVRALDTPSTPARRNAGSTKDRLPWRKKQRHRQPQSAATAEPS